jgi:hypothetical protein
MHVITTKVWNPAGYQNEKPSRRCQMKRMIVAVLCFFASLAIAIPVIAKDHRPEYAGHRGYRERPYGQRHYEHHEYKGHEYAYRGHWKSWNDWDRYAKEHPDLYKHGRYYREGGHLMFRFNEPGTGNSFFFSIGR